MRGSSWRFGFIGLLLAATAGAQNERAAFVHHLLTIPLTGVEGRIDHLAADARGQRLFVAALEHNTVEVIDLRAGRVINHITGLQEPQGIAFAPETNRLFVANGGGARCDVYDGASLQRLESVHGLDDADNVRYDPVERRIYVGYGSGAIAVLDAASGKRLAEVRLGRHPESFQLEPSGPRIFVNLPGASRVVVVDRTRNAVVARWELGDAAANFPMSLDAANHRLFIGCRRPARLLVYDTASGKRVAGVPIGGDTDDLFYDAARRRIYASCGAGVVEVVQQQDADHYLRATTIRTAPGARTSLFIPDLARFCLAVPQRGGQQAEIQLYSVGP